MASISSGLQSARNRRGVGLNACRLRHHFDRGIDRAQLERHIHARRLGGGEVDPALLEGDESRRSHRDGVTPAGRYGNANWPSSPVFMLAVMPVSWLAIATSAAATPAPVASLTVPAMVAERSARVWQRMSRSGAATGLRCEHSGGMNFRSPTFASGLSQPYAQCASHTRLGTFVT